MKHRIVRGVTAVFVSAVLSGVASAQQRPASERIAPPQTGGAVATKPVAAPPGYLIGPEDVLGIMFWRNEQLSGDVVVRPDGKISIPLLNDVQAAGLAPEQLRDVLIQAASKFVEEPDATVVVKQINSRKVFVTGKVAQPGAHPLTANMTVLQLIAVSGGLQEYADASKILIMRTEPGKTLYFRFNYNDVVKQKNVSQNIALRPGDTVVVP